MWREGRRGVWDVAAKDSQIAKTQAPFLVVELASLAIISLISGFTHAQISENMTFSQVARYTERGTHAT